jgi:copper chaperone CopZ
MEKIELKINGLHCNGCSSRLERVLNGMDGVESKVSLEDKKAYIQYDNNKVSLDEIKESIEDAGFSVEE